jgi:MraZ protein
MEVIGPTERTYYNSIYRHGVDEKRRVQIPSMWRPAAGGMEFTLIVWPQSNDGACLRVLPPEQMAKLMAEINSMPNGDPKKTTLKRVIGGASVQVALDKGGRICIPEDMARVAGIVSEAVLNGLLDRFEIWNPERFDRRQAADAVLAGDAFKLLE